MKPSRTKQSQENPQFIETQQQQQQIARFERLKEN